MGKYFQEIVSNVMSCNLLYAKRTNCPFPELSPSQKICEFICLEIRQLANWPEVRFCYGEGVILLYVATPCECFDNSVQK